MSFFRFISSNCQIIGLAIVICGFISGCWGSSQDHQEEIEEWRENRMAKLKGPFGWPSVVGLYWLREGIQFFGSSREVNELIWPPDMPSTIGRFEWDADSVVCWVFPNLGVRINGVDTNKVRMISDVESSRTTVNWKSYFWHLIKRQDKYGIRLLDTLNAARMDLHDIPGFPVKRKWRKEAQVIKADEDYTVRYENVIGMTFDRKPLAILRFVEDGQEFDLAAFDNGDGRYFVIFGDETNGDLTYGGGRYLYLPIAGSEDKTVVLDFNKAENPPCVFTDYATCPLPPEVNELPFEVNAGEKSLTGH